MYNILLLNRSEMFNEIFPKRILLGFCQDFTSGLSCREALLFHCVKYFCSTLRHPCVQCVNQQIKKKIRQQKINSLEGFQMILFFVCIVCNDLITFPSCYLLVVLMKVALCHFGFCFILKTELIPYHFLS